MRKIIQITATAGGEENETDILYALCDDGTVWLIVDSSARDSDDWRRLPLIPQDE